MKNNAREIIESLTIMINGLSARRAPAVLGAAGVPTCGASNGQGSAGVMFTQGAVPEIPDGVVDKRLERSVVVLLHERLVLVSHCEPVLTGRKEPGEPQVELREGRFVL